MENRRRERGLCWKPHLGGKKGMADWAGQKEPAPAAVISRAAAGKTRYFPDLPEPFVALAGSLRKDGKMDQGDLSKLM